jgi:hypothetical protein
MHASRIFLVLLMLLPGAMRAQVNGYAAITSVSGTTLTVGASNEAAASFMVGKTVVIMQMQDDVIGTNTSDNSSFGNLSAIKNAGHYELRTITVVTRSGGVLTQFQVNAALGTSFTTGTNSSLQAITYELLGGGGDYATTAAITAPAWNGSIGGVVALRVGGTLTLQHNITVDGKGFRGGAKDPGTYDVCYPSVYRASSTDATTWRYATKGEGIYKLTNTAWADARGKILNGGGGGNGINAGGAGGGNQTAGGAGGAGWSCSAQPSGGIGGIALGAQVSASRIFMGGGGGGGEGNDNVSTDGGAGGGIILIKAQSIITTGSCGGLKISANGATASNSGNDGAGGGGAGGTIVLNVGSFSIASGCHVNVTANGGNGGSIGSADTHGAGGAGGEGVIIFSSALPTTNITVQTNNGTSGCNNSSAPCNSPAGSATGSDGAGILSDFSVILPIELLRFEAVAQQDRVDLEWSTASETDNAWFFVERSIDLHDWQTVVQLPGAGNSSSVLEYSAEDRAPLSGTSYYRLRQVDTDGSSSSSDVVPVQFDGGHVQLSLFPNPATDHVAAWAVGVKQGRLELFNSLGRSVTASLALADQHADIDLSALPSGSYVVVLTTADAVFQQRLVVRH